MIITINEDGANSSTEMPEEQKKELKKKQFEKFSMYVKSYIRDDNQNDAFLQSNWNRSFEYEDEYIEQSFRNLDINLSDEQLLQKALRASREIRSSYQAGLVE